MPPTFILVEYWTEVFGLGSTLEFLKGTVMLLIILEFLSFSAMREPTSGVAATVKHLSRKYRWYSIYHKYLFFGCGKLELKL